MDKALMKISFMATYIWGMIAHAYCFFHDTFSHDSMSTIYATPGEDLWKIKLGRYLAPIVRQLTVGRMCLPWLTGFVSLFFLALAVYGVCAIFNIKVPLYVALTAGIMVTNITVTATAATYLYELNIDMMALLCAVTAVFIWRFKNKGMFWASIFVWASLGLYQSYVSVTITLMMLVSVQDLLNDKEFEAVFVKGIKGIGTLILGVILYFAVLILLVKIGNIDMNTNTYNGVYNVGSVSIFSVIKRIPGLYVTTLYPYIKNQSVFPWYFIAAINVIFFCIAIFSVLRHIFKKNDFRRKLLVVVLGFLLPFGINTVYLISGRWSHDLMLYAIQLPYVFCFAWMNMSCFSEQRAAKFFNRTMLLLIMVVLFANVRTSNTAYIKKEFEKRATVSVINRVQSCLEQRDDYIYGKTKIVFIGAPRFNMPGFEGIKNVTGLSINSVFTNDTLVQSEYHPYRTFYQYYMGDASVLAEDQTWLNISNNEFVKKMTIFPDAESMQIVDGVMVVKLGEF